MSRAVAEALDCRVVGVEMFGAFVDEARRRADAAGLGHRCEFRCEDIREFLATPHRFDVALLLAVGSPLGPMDRSIAGIRRVVRPGGSMIIDDAYTLDDSTKTFPGYEYVDSRETLLAQLTSHGDEIVRERVLGPDEMRAIDRRYIDSIESRAGALAAAHPDDADLIRGYVDRQERAAAAWERNAVSAAWLLRRA